MPNDTPEANWPLLIEGTQKLVDYAESVDVTLSLEVMEHIPRSFYSAARCNLHSGAYHFPFF